MKDLIKSVVEDGIVDADEVKALEEAIYADGKVDQDEADAVFEINDAVSGNENDPGWDALFVKTISDFVLEDDDTPGVIDEGEGQYIVDKIGADGQVDGAEKALLANLKEKATAIECQALNDLIATL